MEHYCFPLLIIFWDYIILQRPLGSKKRDIMFSVCSKSFGKKSEKNHRAMVGFLVFLFWINILQLPFLAGVVLPLFSALQPFLVIGLAAFPLTNQIWAGKESSLYVVLKAQAKIMKGIHNFGDLEIKSFLNKEFKPAGLIEDIK